MIAAAERGSSLASPVDTAPCGLLCFADDGRVLLANATLLELVGRAREDVEGQHVESLLTVASRIFYQTHFFPLIRLHGRADEIYLTLRAADGRDVPVLTNAVRRQEAGGFVSTCVLMPIRRRQEYEDALLQAKKAAEEAGRRKAQFLSTLSHELRTPMGAILGYMDLLDLEVEGPLNEKQREQVGRARDAAHFLLELMEDVLDFSKVEARAVRVELQPVPVEDALAEAESMMMVPLREAELSYERRACEPGLAVRADPKRLQQVLLNLLTNAVKYSDAGSRVSTAGERAGDRVLIHVEDTGPGIPADEIGHIFEPFTQLERGRTRQKGVGLGLGISRELARAMGGDITVQSTEGEGTVFTVALRPA